MSCESNRQPPRPWFRFDMPPSHGIASAFLGAAALLPSAAMAQSAPSEAPEVQVEATSTQSSDGYRAEEVKNTKLGGTPHDLPQTINVVTEKLMDEQDATTLRKALRNVPGITFNAGEGGSQGDHPIVRGFSGQSDMYLDGLRDSGSYRRDSFNIEEVEVLKGPSSMLFGRGSTGGTINQISKTAKAGDFNEATLAVGTADKLRGSADVNKQVDDHIAVRLNVMAEKSGVAGRDEVQNITRGFAPTVTLGLGLPTEVTLSYLHQENDNLPDFGVPLLNGQKPAGVDWSNYYGLKKYDYEESKTDIATARVRHKFDGPVELTNTTRMGRVARDQSVTRPQSPNVAANTVLLNKTAASERDNTILTNQTDAKIGFSTGPLQHELHTGVELSRENYITRNKQFLSGNATGNLTNPNTNATYAVGDRQTQWSEVRADTYAGYLMDQVKLTDQWEVVGGLRYDSFKSDQTVRSNTVSSNANRYTSDDVVSYRGSLSYKPTAQQHYYVAYGTSATPSATDLSPTAANQGTDPEKTRSYELGGKVDVMDGGLSLNGAVFRIEKNNMRVTAADGSGTEVLDGERRVDGFELGATGHITPEWDVTAAYTFLKSETVKTTTAAQLGKDIRNTPRQQASLWSSYKLTPDIAIGAGAFYTGKQYADDANTVALDSYVTFDAMASYQLTENVDLQLNIENITDERYISTASNTLNGEVGAGRSATLSTRVRF